MYLLRKTTVTSLRSDVNAPKVAFTPRGFESKLCQLKPPQYLSYYRSKNWQARRDSRVFAPQNHGDLAALG
ncbi:MAG: hypothetical protein FWF11_03140, partial [Coriobacteriia bacterium]|nr:hypothetical protein [Coriobacteriia bacterium]